MTDETFQDALTFASTTTEFMTPVQATRSKARLRMAEAGRSLSGKRGLSKETQIERLDAAKTALESAVAELSDAINIVSARDHDAYQASKAAQNVNDGLDLDLDVSEDDDTE